MATIYNTLATNFQSQSNLPQHPANHPQNLSNHQVNKHLATTLDIQATT